MSLYNIRLGDFWCLLVRVSKHCICGHNKPKEPDNEVTHAASCPRQPLSLGANSMNSLIAPLQYKPHVSSQAKRLHRWLNGIDVVNMVHTV